MQYRYSNEFPETKGKLTPIKAIRSKCIECCAGQKVEVRLCPIKDCALWGYRMGHRPKSDDQAEIFEDDSGETED